MSDTCTKVLVVDDDPDVREIVSIVLQIYGVPGETASDGVECLVRLRASRHIGLVLLDLMMPKKNGLDVLREMRSDPVLANVPVIVISGNCDAEPAALALGARSCLLKPLEIDHLMHAVARYVPVAQPMQGVTPEAFKQP